MSYIDAVALIAIRTYQRFISPRKGFSCAFAKVHQLDSCSQRVLDIIRQHGLCGGVGRIRQQFKDCSRAAATLSTNQRTDLDCSLGGCLDVGGPEGCLGGGVGGGSGTSSGAADCAGGAADCLWPFGGRNRRRSRFLWFLLIVVCLPTGYFTYGNQVKGIEIRLIDSASEDRDRKWGLVSDSELPDYQIIATVNGQKLESTTAHNHSARDWVEVLFDQRFRLGDLQHIQITNRQLLSNKVLDDISSISASGRGDNYQYRVIRAWSF